MDNKGLSPLIATVLIVGFTILLAVIVINFVLTTTESQTEEQKCQIEAEQGCLEFAGGSKITAGFNNPILTINNLAPRNARYLITEIDANGVPIKTFETTTTAPFGSAIPVDLSDPLGDGPGPDDFPLTPASNHKLRVIPIVDETVEGVNCIVSCSASPKRIDIP